jgi:hypothetical protein
MAQRNDLFGHKEPDPGTQGPQQRMEHKIVRENDQKESLRGYGSSLRLEAGS